MIKSVVQTGLLCKPVFSFQLPATRIRIAAADGLESALESAAVMTLFLLRAGPTLLLWGVVVAAGWLLVRRFRGSSA